MGRMPPQVFQCPVQMHVQYEPFSKLPLSPKVSESGPFHHFITIDTHIPRLLAKEDHFASKTKIQVAHTT